MCLKKPHLGSKQQPNSPTFCLKWEKVGATSSSGKLGIKSPWHQGLHENPSSPLSPGSCLVNSAFIQGGGNSLSWLLKAILLSSYACARRRRSQKEMKFAKPPEWLLAGEGRSPGSMAPPSSTGEDSRGSPGAEGTRASQPHHCLLGAGLAAGLLKLGGLVAIPAFQQPGIEQGAQKGWRAQGFLLLQCYPRVTTPNPFPQQPMLAILPPLLFNREHFQEQEVSLSRHSLSVTETSSQPGTQIFS